MKTLLIGDLHLKSQLILPIVDKIIQTHNIKRIIFLGDYVDLHGQTNNIQLYAKDLTFLYSWKIDKEQNGIDVINLIGNHDAYYLLGEQAPFSIQNLEVFFAIQQLLQDLNLQVAYQLDDYLVSHAGFNLIFDPKEWHFNLYTKEHEEELDILAYTIGPMRGGKALGGSPLWAHFRELELLPNQDFPKQIVGHTPPAKLIKKLPIEKTKMQFWTVKEFQKFLTLFEPEEYNIKLLFTVLFFTGLRLWEALALTWQDIDFSSNTIHITKSVYVNKGVTHISTTKTKAGTRRIVINKKLSQELQDWEKRQKHLLEQFTNNSLTLQVFQNSPITITKNAIEKQYKKIIERDSTLKKIRIHDFRHSHASLLINQGEDYLVVKERLGHASITTTIDTYSHLYPSKQKDLADKLDDLL